MKSSPRIPEPCRATAPVTPGRRRILGMRWHKRRLLEQP